MKGSGLLKAVFFSLFLFSAYSGMAQETHPDTEHMQVNINTADAETIAMVLNGVGMARAEAIVTYRQENGEFKTLEDLIMVRGLGEITVRNNQDKIVFE